MCGILQRALPVEMLRPYTSTWCCRHSRDRVYQWDLRCCVGCRQQSLYTARDVQLVLPFENLTIKGALEEGQGAVMRSNSPRPRRGRRLSTRSGGRFSFLQVESRGSLEERHRRSIHRHRAQL